MISEILEKRILEEQEERKTRERSGLFNPSSMGRCYRFIYWNRKNEEPSNPLTLDTLKFFRAGEIYHRDIQSLLPKEEVEVAFQVEDFSLRVDWLTDSFCADFKTINNWGWKIIQKKTKEEIEQDKITNVLQVMVECHLLKREIGILIFIHKDDYKMHELVLNLKDWQSKLDEDLRIMRDYWSKQELPPAEPRAYGGKECNYCCYKDKCVALNS